MADASLGVARLRTSLDTSGLRTGLAQAKGETEKATRDINERLNTIGSGLTRTGRRLSLFVTAPLVAAGAGIVKLSQDFEKSMNRVQALSGATGESLTRLRDQARQLGADTQFSASEAADAMSFLAMAGFDVNQIYASMPDTLNLAAAAQLDMGSAADIVSNIMTGFGISTDKLGSSVDVLTKAFISSNTDLSMLGEGMKFVGPIASGLGVSFEETTAALGLLSNAGIQAGSAGTGLRRILGTLASEADKLGIATTDTAGNLRPLADILDELNERGLTTAEALEIFGDRGGPAMQALLSQGGAALRAFTTELENAGGTAAEVAETQIAGLHGMIKELQSAGEELALSLGDAGLLTAAKNLVTGLTNLIRRFNELPQPAKTAAVVVGGVAAAAGPLLIAVGTLITNIPKVVAGFQLLRAGMLPFLGPAGILAGAAAGYFLLNDAMNAGHRERAQASRDFRDLVVSMGAYRDQLVITGEEERSQLIQSLERRKEALDRVLQMQQTMIRSLEAEVVAFANMPWYKQLFNVGGVNVNLDALEKAEGDLKAIQSEISAIDTQLGQVRTMEITPNVTVPDPLDTGAGYDSLGLPEDGSTREIEIVVTVRNAESAQELFDALAGEGTAVNRAVNRLGATPELILEGMQRRAELFEQAMARAWEIPDVTADEFDYLVRRGKELRENAEAFEHAMSVSVMMGPDGTRGPLELEAQRRPGLPIIGLPDGPFDTLRGAQATEAARLRNTLDARVEQYNDELEERLRLEASRQLPIIGLPDGPFDTLTGEQATEAARLRNTLDARVEQFIADLEARLPEVTEVLSWEEIVANAIAASGGASRLLPTFGAAGPLTPRSAAADMARDTVVALVEAGAPLEEIRAAVEAWTRVMPQTREAIDEVTGGLLNMRVEAEKFISPAQAAAARRAGFSDITARGSGGVFGEASIVRKADADRITQAANEFAATTVAAGFAMGDAAIRAIQDGDIGGIIRAGLAGAGSILGGADLGALSLFGGSVGIGSIVAGGLGLLGTLFGALFSGGGASEAERARAETRRVGSVPAININFSVQQQNTYNGAPSDPQNEQAFRRQADALFESIYRRHLGPRLDRIESRLGIAGAA